MKRVGERDDVYTNPFRLDEPIAVTKPVSFFRESIAPSFRGKYADRAREIKHSRARPSKLRSAEWRGEQEIRANFRQNFSAARQHGTGAAAPNETCSKGTGDGDEDGTERRAE